MLELIITSVLVVIVVFGIFAVNNVLNNSSQDFGQRYFVKSETQTTLNHILNNASMAVGTGTNISFSGGGSVLDEGIVFGTDANEGWGAVGGDQYSFCIHQDVPSLTPDNTTVNSPATTPPNYSTSRWLCYTWYGPGNLCSTASINNCSSYEIWYCARAYDSTINPSRGAGACNTSTPSGPISSALYLGTAQSNPFSTSSALPASFSSTSGFSITLYNCLDNTLTSGACGSSNNPTATLSGSVFPSQVGVQQN